VLIESLARLALLQEELKKNEIILNSEDFMKETQEIIDTQISFLQKDLSFQSSNPGPYMLGLGIRSIHIFPPIYTESADWVMIVFNEKEQVKEKIFIFHSLYGLIENLQNAFKYIQEQNASTTGENTQSSTEA
jgi:hypothetical protein